MNLIHKSQRLFRLFLFTLVLGGVIITPTFVQGQSNNSNIYLPIVLNECPPTPPAPPNKIVFTSNRDGDEEIYTMDQDGSHILRLTNSPGRDYAAKWSPNRTKIAFTSERTVNGEIYLMNIDGSCPTRLTFNEANDVQPNWSPDGTMIVFASERSGSWGIYTMSAIGSNVSRIGTFWGLAPYWSPDGKKIAFTGQSAIYLVNIDGTNLKNLTSGGMDDSCSVWSPDGTLIAFIGYDRGKDVFVIPSNGGAITRLTYNDLYAFGCPSWRADSQLLAYDQMVSSYNWEIFTIDYFTRITTRLTNNTVEDAMADWAH
jgi:Tol biopolymer transport system component